jgi:biotin carboxyl carrier protein
MKRLLIVDGQEKLLDLAPAPLAPRLLEAGSAVVVDNGRVHRITFAGGHWIVNGKTVHIALADPRDRRRSSASAADSGRRDIKAAMPGKVVKLLVEPGQLVEPGAGLLILEAMKMQNEVRSPGPGAIAAIRVQPGDTVASGQVLVTLE